MKSKVISISNLGHGDIPKGLQENLGFTADDLVPAAGCHGAAGTVITEAACPALGLAAGGSVEIGNAEIAALLSLYPNPNNGSISSY